MKYRVLVHESATAEVFIEANDHEEATDIAQDMWQEGLIPFHNCSVATEVCEEDT